MNYVISCRTTWVYWFAFCIILCGSNRMNAFISLFNHTTHSAYIQSHVLAYTRIYIQHLSLSFSSNTSLTPRNRYFRLTAARKQIYLFHINAQNVNVYIYYCHPVIRIYGTYSHSHWDQAKARWKKKKRRVNTGNSRNFTHQCARANETFYNLPLVH